MPDLPAPEASDDGIDAIVSSCHRASYRFNLRTDLSFRHLEGWV